MSSSPSLPLLRAPWNYPYPRGLVRCFDAEFLHDIQKLCKPFTYIRRYISTELSSFFPLFFLREKLVTTTIKCHPTILLKILGTPLNTKEKDNEHWKLHICNSIDKNDHLIRIPDINLWKGEKILVIDNQI